jgi:3-oxoacyl-[acyl-carrier protein] reductase
MPAGTGGGMRLKDRTAIVTGAGSGFGAAIARAFAREGALVVVQDLDGAAAERVAGEVGEAAVASAGDVTDAEAVARAVAAATALGGRVDVVVNNAGYTHRNKPMLEVTEEEFDRIFAVNVRAIFLMTRAVVPAMRDAGGGVILNIGSTAGVRPRPGLTWYNASKGAVNLVSKSMALELAPDRIRVNCVAPVMGATGMLEAFMGLPDTAENRAKFVATIPMGRLSEPEDIAEACVYLASDTAAFVTGVVLPVDGGRTV